MAPNEDAIAAVVALHEDLEAWIDRGERASFDRFKAALAPDFRQIGCDGVHRRRAEVIESVARLPGRRQGCEIRIEDTGQQRLGRFTLVVYREVQQDHRGEVTNRWSTALLSPGPDGWQWHHLHECWAAGD